MLTYENVGNVVYFCPQSLSRGDVAMVLCIGDVVLVYPRVVEMEFETQKCPREQGVRSELEFLM